MPQIRSPDRMHILSEAQSSTMSRRDQQLSETDIRPAGAVVSMIRADAEDSRAWLKAAAVCTALSQHQIRHVAVAHMPSPFEIVRTKLGGSYFLACYGGEGRVLVDGRWTKCRPGQAVLLPPGTLHAFHTAQGKTWDFCWVRYQERSGQKPLAAAQTPVIARFDPEPLRLAILGLHRECSTTQSPAAMTGWADLIQHYVRTFAEPATLDPRLWTLWEKVSLSLSDPWTITDMAAEVHLSEKQLQRLCLKELGRSPRQQLIWLRMRRATERTRGTKIEAIAHQVGYQNPFVFSTTFKKVMGWSPSEYPGRR
jgi:AraC-like DNA-binding protein